MLEITLNDEKVDVTKLTEDDKDYLCKIGHYHATKEKFEIVKENLLNKDGTLNYEFITTKLAKAFHTIQSLDSKSTEICECGAPKLSDEDREVYNDAEEEFDVIDYLLAQKFKDYATVSLKPQNNEKEYDDLYMKCADYEALFDKSEGCEIDHEDGINFNFTQITLKNGEKFNNVNRYQFSYLLKGLYAEQALSKKDIVHIDFNFETMSKELQELITFCRLLLTAYSDFFVNEDGVTAEDENDMGGLVCLENYIMSELTKKGYFKYIEDEKYSYLNPKLWTEKHYVIINQDSYPKNLE